ncbi:hypothetical protein K466DRAFT_336357 [Polyporus arcularius HHB13444]|uniref:Uncharacterized protein n=1 Tax=Polyporus arcularius HHB13444 TaxID=1314778 RepID=A0A5C3NVT9_9APHY|nr:hypothetical protein K466DRAFT_336357 [Polyporus arcularius HHB13444]
MSDGSSSSREPSPRRYRPRSPGSDAGSVASSPWQGPSSALHPSSLQSPAPSPAPLLRQPVGFGASSNPPSNHRASRSSPSPQHYHPSRDVHEGSAQRGGPSKGKEREGKEHSPTRRLTLPFPIHNLNMYSSLRTRIRRKRSASTPTRTISVQEAHPTIRTTARTVLRIELTSVFHQQVALIRNLISPGGTVPHLKPLRIRISSQDRHTTVTTTRRSVRVPLLIVRSKQQHHPRTRHLHLIATHHIAATPSVILHPAIIQTATTAIHVPAEARIPTCRTTHIPLHNSTATPMTPIRLTTSTQATLSRISLMLRISLFSCLSRIPHLLRLHKRNDTSHAVIITRPHPFTLLNPSRRRLPS